MEEVEVLTKEEKKAKKRQAEVNQARRRQWRNWGLILAGLILAAAWIYSRYVPVPTGESQKPVDRVLENDWYLGQKEAPVVVVEYSDFQCPACKLYSPLIKELASKYEGQVVVVYRHFPLKEIHQTANLAAQAAEAAGKQGKFFEMSERLFESQADWADKGKAKQLMIGYAKELGLNETQFVQDLESKEVRGLVKADYLSALSQRLNSTPTFFINGERVASPQGIEAFSLLIDPLLPATTSATADE